MAKTLVLYHAKCPDGLASAWAAWKSLGDQAEYLPVQYGDQPPDVTGCIVYIVDFSFPRQVLIEMAEKAERVVLLDHHKTAEADLQGLQVPKLEITFDMDESGATLTWKHFFGTQECWLVNYARDRDLWRFQLPHSKAVNAYLQSLPPTFQEYQKAYELGIEQVAMLGEGCLSWLRYYVESTKRLARRGTFLNHEVPIVNAPYTAISEVVGELAEGHPFAVGWHVREDGRVVYSLRSRGDFDVSALAKSVGGGGHRQAAGFSLEWFPWELTNGVPALKAQPAPELSLPPPTPEPTPAPVVPAQEPPPEPVSVPPENPRLIMDAAEEEPEPLWVRLLSRLLVRVFRLDT